MEALNEFRDRILRVSEDADDDKCVYESRMQSYFRKENSSSTRNFDKAFETGVEV